MDQTTRAGDRTSAVQTSLSIPDNVTAVPYVVCNERVCRCFNRIKSEMRGASPVFGQARARRVSNGKRTARDRLVDGDKRT